jgi:hypothetical protein
MSRRPARFTQAEVESAIRAAQSAGLTVAEARVLPDGTIVIVSGRAPADEAVSSGEILDARLRGEAHGQG